MTAIAHVALATPDRQPAYHTPIDVNYAAQPFADSHTVWAQVGWINPTNHDIYGLSIPAGHARTIHHLVPLYISLGSTEWPAE